MDVMAADPSSGTSVGMGDEGAAHSALLSANAEQSHHPLSPSKGSSPNWGRLRAFAMSPSQSCPPTWTWTLRVREGRVGG